MKIAPEGYPFIAFFFALTVLCAAMAGPRWAVVPLVLTFFMFFFFRDPERVVPFEEGFIAPADGKIIVIAKEEEALHLKRMVRKISIFMSPMNVHVNRAPCDGEVVSVVHTPGGYAKAWKDEASLTNENTAMVLRCDSGGEILVRQIAGALARRTVCRVAPGARLSKGERYGLIKFSSRLDVYLPPDVVVRVTPGQMVRAGETVLATLPSVPADAVSASGDGSTQGEGAQ